MSEDEFGVLYSRSNLAFERVKHDHRWNGDKKSHGGRHECLRNTWSDHFKSAFRVIAQLLEGNNDTNHRAKQPNERRITSDDSEI